MYSYITLPSESALPVLSRRSGTSPPRPWYDILPTLEPDYIPVSPARLSNRSDTTPQKELFYSQPRGTGVVVYSNWGTKVLTKFLPTGYL